MFSGRGNPPLLSPVSEPICAYLRSRPDTVKCLVAMITAGEGEEGSVGGGGAAADGGEGARGLLEELRKVRRSFMSFQLLLPFLLPLDPPLQAALASSAPSVPEDPDEAVLNAYLAMDVEDMGRVQMTTATQAQEQG